MKILIVEDDEIVRKNVAEGIPWEKNGHEIVGVAPNGMQAYEMALYTCPDIILSDIEMPVMNGLELVDKLREVMENVRVIFLTAYDKFDYAKEAVRLRVYEYILKDSGEDEILRIVNRVADEIHVQNGNVHLTHAGEKILLDNCIFKLLKEDTPEEEKEKICRKLDMGFKDWQYQVIVFKADEKKESKRRASEINVTEAELKKILTEEMEEAGIRFWALRWYQYQVMLMGMRKDALLNLSGILERLIMKWEKSLQQYVIVVGVGRICLEMGKLSAGLDDAVFAVNDDSQGKVRSYKEMNQTKFIRQIRDYIQENYADPELSLNKLSEQVYLTPTYISSLFKRYMNSNFKEYLINLRMREACKLLKSTELKTYEISERVGYPNPQYFSVLFKKYTGETPTGYHNRFLDCKK